MSFMLITSSFVTTLLIPAEEFRPRLPICLPVKLPAVRWPI